MLHMYTLLPVGRYVFTKRLSNAASSVGSCHFLTHKTEHDFMIAKKRFKEFLCTIIVICRKS